MRVSYNHNNKWGCGLEGIRSYQHTLYGIIPLFMENYRSVLKIKSLCVINYILSIIYEQTWYQQITEMPPRPCTQS